MSENLRGVDSQYSADSPPLCITFFTSTARRSLVNSALEEAAWDHPPPGMSLQPGYERHLEDAHSVSLDHLFGTACRLNSYRLSPSVSYHTDPHHNTFGDRALATAAPGL